jgi:hypothetical protein
VLKPPLVALPLCECAKRLPSSLGAVPSRSKLPVKRDVPTHIATAPNQVWTWDYSDIKVIPIFLLRSYISNNFFVKKSE